MTMLRLAACVILIILCGCTTADFKAVDALRHGMTKQEARGAIEAFGFVHREPELIRPAQGWPTEAKGYFDVGFRAYMAEQREHIRVDSAEAYPVTHGLLGYGWIYLFYGPDQRLVWFYRLQIN